MITAFRAYLITFGLAAAACAQSYTVADLGTMGGTSSGALAVNDVGEVAGITSFSNGAERAFVWSKTSGMKSLGLLHAADRSSTANAINNSGQVAGTSGSYAFLWTESTGMKDLGNLGGSATGAFGINSAGDVAGSSYLSGDSIQHAFLWTAGGGMQDLGTLGGDSSSAYAVNDSDEVVGTSLLSDNVTEHAFLWTQTGGMQDLGTLGGTSSIAFGVNSSGEVVGISDTTANYAGFTWVQKGGMRAMNLGLSVALSINASGQAVGYWSHGATQGGILWTRARGVRSLNSLIGNGPSVQVANAINKAGQIAASGVNQHALLLTPAAK